MSITLVGALLIPLALYLTFANPHRLYLIAVFFLPFTATAVINVGSGQTASGVQVSLFVAFLLLLKHCITVWRRGSILLPHRGRASLIWLGLFVLAVILSLVMPIYLNGHVQVPANTLLDLSTHPLYLQSINITSTLYVVLGFSFAYLTVAFNLRPDMIRATLKTFLASCAFSALWACLEFVCKLTGIPYPAIIFNSSATFGAAGYKEVLGEGVFRLSSVAVEPSIFAQVLLVGISLYIPFVFGPKSLFGKRLDRGLFALILIILLMTTSSTAYVGSVILVLLTLFLLAIRGVVRLRHFLVTLAGVMFAGLIYAVTPLVQRVVESVLLSKGGGYSALERLKTIHDSYEMFLKYPVLGIGWASITSHDLIVNILANCGLVGLAVFTTAIYFIFRALCRSVWSRAKTLGAMMQLDFAALLALAIILITSIISGFIYMFPFFWFVCGFAVAAAAVPVGEAVPVRRVSLPAVNMQQMAPDPNG